MVLSSLAAEKHVAKSANSGAAQVKLWSTTPISTVNTNMTTDTAMAGSNLGLGSKTHSASEAGAKVRVGVEVGRASGLNEPPQAEHSSAFAGRTFPQMHIIFGLDQPKQTGSFIELGIRCLP